MAFWFMKNLLDNLLVLQQLYDIIGLNDLLTVSCELRRGRPYRLLI